MCITAKLLSYQFVRSKILRYKTLYFIPNLGHLYDFIDGNVTKQPYAKIIAPMLEMDEEHYEFIVKKDKTIEKIIKGLAIPSD